MSKMTLKFSNLEMMFKLSLIVVIALMASILSFVNANRENRSPKFTIEQLLTEIFPYSDPRNDHQLDMDPCKSGKTL